MNLIFFKIKNNLKRKNNDNLEELLLPLHSK
jgi:hypothetical protein